MVGDRHLVVVFRVVATLRVLHGAAFRAMAVGKPEKSLRAAILAVPEHLVVANKLFRHNPPNRLAPRHRLCTSIIPVLAQRVGGTAPQSAGATGMLTGVAVAECFAVRDQAILVYVRALDLEVEKRALG